MPDLNPLTFSNVYEPATVVFGFDVLVAVRVVAEDGAVLLDTTDRPASVAALLAGCDADDLRPVVEQWAIPWLLKQRGLTDG